MTTKKALAGIAACACLAILALWFVRTAPIVPLLVYGIAMMLLGRFLLARDLLAADKREREQIAPEVGHQN